jgi:hypothetical protein
MPTNPEDIMSEHSPALPPRGERFTDKTAIVVWAAVSALPAAAQQPDP